MLSAGDEQHGHVRQLPQEPAAEFPEPYMLQVISFQGRVVFGDVAGVARVEVAPPKGLSRIASTINRSNSPAFSAFSPRNQASRQLAATLRQIETTRRYRTDPYCSGSYICLAIAGTNTIRDGDHILRLMWEKIPHKSRQGTRVDQVDQKVVIVVRNVGRYCDR
jgi:hypothetical protein